MAFYPKATRRIVSWANAITRKKGYTRPEVVVLHIAVSQRSSKSLYGFFTGSGRGQVCSHFYVADDGSVEQYIDTARRSSADYSGGDRTISIETAGGYGADLNKGWSPAARESIAQILAWAHKTHGIPLRLMSSSRKTEKGIGYHRLGVPATRTQKLLARSQTGGELWSGAVGKVCPGAARQAQVPGIVARAVEIAGGKPAPAPGGTSKPVTPPTKPSGKAWPAVALPVTSKHTAASHAAWVKLLTDVGYKDKSLTTKFQRWLKALKDRNGRSYYRGIIEADRGQKPVFGPYLIDALQRKLKDDGLYKGQLDAFRRPYAQARGPMLIGSEINYLNRQRKYY